MADIWQALENHMNGEEQHKRDIESEKSARKECIRAAMTEFVDKGRDGWGVHIGVVYAEIQMLKYEVANLREAIEVFKKHFISATKESVQAAHSSACYLNALKIVNESAEKGLRKHVIEETEQ